MDELLHHCLRELAFDGDLGSNPSRLRDFIVDFYSHSTAPHTQHVDDDFCAFVWSFVVQQPNVLVGTKPPGITAEVWIAPQTSAKRKATAKGQVLVPTTPPQLDIIPDAKSRSLEDLIHEYGDDLRLAVDTDSIYASITGSHIRFPKLSPMVYSALQLITRGRDSGISVIELGQTSKYDQKTCFYLVKQLTDLHFVSKVRRGGVGSHFCIHKYFFDRSPSWQAIRDEESRADLEPVDEGAQVLDDVQDISPEIKDLNFSHIDARHLSSLPLVRARVVKLLKASKNHMHPSNNMIITIGFKQPTKTDRRFFQSRIREMLQEGVVEKVVVPNKKKNLTTSITCLRLLDEDGSKVSALAINDGPLDDVNDEESSGVKFNSTIHKLIINLLEAADTTGMTLNDISSSMCNFDRRTIELLLTRAEKCPPPEHLNDLGISGLMETSGRERRHRYFTVSAYHKLVSQENLNKSSAGLSALDWDSIGGFMPIDSEAFYSDVKAMWVFQDDYKHIAGVSREDGSTLKKKPAANSSVDWPPKIGRPRKAKKEVDEGGEPATTPRASKKRKLSTDDVTEPQTPAKKRKITKGKIRATDEVVQQDKSPVSVEPKKRGRPRKNPLPDGTPSSPVQQKPKPARFSRKSARIMKAVEQTENALSGVESDIATMNVVPSASSTSRREIDTEGIAPELITHPPSPETTEVELPTTNPFDSVGAPVRIETMEATGGDGLIPMDVDHATSHHSREDTSTPIDPLLLQTVPISPATKTISQSNRRVNVSHLRRENELYRVIEMLGGIVNTQTKDMFDVHTALVETLAAAGEPTSAPVGTRTDKRTAMATLNSLESQGRIKHTKTMITGPAGIGRPTVIVYLPDTPEETLNAFLADIARGTVNIPAQPVMARKLDDPVDYGPDPSLLNKTGLPLQLLQVDQTSISDLDAHSEKNTARVNELFSYDDDTIRAVLLTERTTLGQFYGNIVAKAIRARELHVTTINAFEAKLPFPELISHGHRILTLSYFCFDLPLDLYCSLLSPLFHHEQLSEFLADPEKRKTLVRDLPQNLRSILQIGKSRARSRFLDILELLRCLDLVVPLIPSTSDTPFISLEQRELEQPAAFEKASMEGWTVSTPTTAPNYWQFKTSSSLYHWASNEQFLPLLQCLPVSSPAEVAAYWDALRDACSISGLTPSSTTAPPVYAPAEDVKVARSLRRSVSWNVKYAFTWHQTRYMQRFIDVTTGRTPLDNEDGGKELERICYIISAPRAAVEAHFATVRQKTVKHLGRVKHRRHQAADEQRSKDAARDAQAQATLARRAAEARQHREQEWEELVKRVHPEPSQHVGVRLKKVQTQFLQSVSNDAEKWETKIRKAFQESEAAVTQVLKPSQPSLPRIHVAVVPPPTVQAPVGEKSVQTLIAEQGPPLTAADRKVESKRKRKRKNEDSDIEDGPKKPQRRHRFQWNKEYDELARDASVIVRARCRDGVRLDWGAFEKVFPAVPRNSVRQRLSHIRETPGNEAYLTRLEDRWYDLWIKHRGTASLPDHDVNSATNFDLARHIEFLRRHIDKNAIRVGYAQPQGNVAADMELPITVDDLLKRFDVVDTAPVGPTWDFMWTGVVEEDREKRLSSLPFTKVYGELIDQPSPDSLALAEGALKMVFGTPAEHYEAEAASNFLRSAADDQTISTATRALLTRGVFSKLVRDHHRPKPGRQLKISDANQAALGGPISAELFQDATGLDESFVNGETEAWREWPLLATDGDIAALIQLTSEGKLDFKVDTTGPQAARPALDWNSKKADDDQIETAVFVMFHELSIQRSPSQAASPSLAPMDIDGQDSSKETRHGQTVDGTIACCKRTCYDGVFDCSGCLDEQWAISSPGLTEEEMPRAQLLLWAVGQAGDKGVTKRDLVESTGTIMELLMPIVQKLSDGPLPLLYWMGYSSLVLVSAAHIQPWTVTLPSDNLINIFPRRWIDIAGAKLMKVWESAIRAVVGTIVFRPGISQSELRWRLRLVYDRQELYDILQYLLDEGFLRASDSKIDGQLVQTLEEDEEIEVFYFLCERKKWYLSM